MFWSAAGFCRRCTRRGRARLVGGWGCRRCTQWGGGLPSLSPPCPAFSLLSCPLSPRPPSPAGKGETQSLFRRGLPPPAPLHLTACDTYSPFLYCTRRGRAFFVASLPRLSLLPCPPSPSGKGETKVISCKGLRPLHPRAEPKRRWEQGRTTHPAGACPAGRRLTLPPLYPAGGVPALSPPCPAFSLLSCPPSPEGKDRPPARARRALFPAALAIPAPGERTISNAEVPLPRSPLSLAAGTANRKAVLSLLRRVGDSEGAPAGCRIGRSNQCRAGSVAGMQGAKPLA